MSIVCALKINTPDHIPSCSMPSPIAMAKNIACSVMRPTNGNIISRNSKMMTQALPQCVFCLDDMSDESQTITLQGCKHVMHTSCFSDYVTYNMNKNEAIVCPVCRHVVINLVSPPTPAPAPAPAPAIVTVTPVEGKRRCLTPCFIVFVIGVNLIMFLAIRLK